MGHACKPDKNLTVINTIKNLIASACSCFAHVSIPRHFIVLSGENRMVSLREEPSLALLQPRLSEDKERLVLEAPGMDPLSLRFSDIAINPVRSFR